MTQPEASKPESAAVEPVAWMYTNRLGNHYCTTNRHPEWTSNGSIETSLIPATTLTALTERVERLESENARLRRALLPFAQLNKRSANYVIQPDEQIVREAVRALEK